ncbi:MAG TPA: pyridoxal phosphate-dependent aminotransferase family protein [Methylomirabilota bacterium]|nr:pyridoxal phosphate-dependent aminotransferase family protein [Methylomirabilota bacterium]
MAHPDVLLDQLASPELRINNKVFVSFCSNNYLGLSMRPEVIEASKAALIKFSNGTSESRKLGGNLRILEELEQTLSDYKEKEDTIIFATGLLANVGVISAITDINFYMELFYQKANRGTETVIIGDQLNHRSIQMGVKLSRAKHVRYLHNDMKSLEEKLEEHKKSNLFIITDSVFSMDGDLAPLDQITKLANEYQAAVMIDDAHGSGVYGKRGRGAAEHFGVSNEIDFLMGTLSKAFGGLGGFVSAKKEIVDMLKINTSTYYFTSSLPASVAAGLIAAIKIAEREEALRVRLWKNVYRMIKGLFDLGIDFPLRFSQIIPIMVYVEKKAYELEEFLYDYGILCSAVTVPAVAPGKARLRASINASHTDEHIDRFLNGISDAITKFHIPTVQRKKSEWDTFIKESPDYILQLINKKR